MAEPLVNVGNWTVGNDRSSVVDQNGPVVVALPPVLLAVTV